MENWELIAKFLSGEASDRERSDLEQLLKTDREMEQLYPILKKEWELSGELNHVTQTFNKEKAWQTVEQKIQMEERSERKGQEHRFSMKWMYGMAALLIITLIPLWLLFGSDKEDRILSIQTEGQLKEVTLPDGSKVYLNASSRITYTGEFQERKVELTGEAFFDVKHDPSHPFVVTNPLFKVTVLGTSFNVSAYPEQAEAVVAVSSGTVNFTSKKNQTLSLIRGQSAKLDKTKSSLSLSDSTDANVLAWRTGQMIFNDMPLAQVSHVLRSYFGKEVKLSNPALGNCRFTGTFNRPEEKEVIEVLKSTLPVKIIQTEKQIVISGKGC